MKSGRQVLFAILCVTSFAATLSADESQSAATRAETQPTFTIVTLGDSITKGKRPGVKSEETFTAILQEALQAEGFAAELINVGIGGERTDQALKRFESVSRHRPRLVTVMYGTNDSYVDVGGKESRLSLAAYRDNLRQLVAKLLLQGIEPILMTEPRWADDASPNGLGENPNVRLTPFMSVCREVARECQVPLVDHFAHWTKARKNGQVLREWTTDGCHPNPRGHREMAELMKPVLLGRLRPDGNKIAFQVKLETVLKHDDGTFLWFHPRVAAMPGFGKRNGVALLMTLQKHLGASDHYSGLSVMRSDDLGKTWTGPDLRKELDWVREPGGINIAVADVTPGWHPQTKKLIAVGAQVRYSPEGDQLEDKRRSHQTAYAVFDPASDLWSSWQRPQMPSGEQFNFARSGCAQWVVEPEGTVLLPFYIGESERVPYSTTVARFAFDGSELKYQEHGNVMSLEVERGLYEPSLIRFQDRIYLTIRNDVKGYVTRSDDGLHYRPIKPWLFDDGEELGSYNTQQHWLTHNDGLFLVYTRRGADNDHVFRHRAPLFIAQVDPIKLRVIRETERVLVPERGATLGNFGATDVSANESWVSVAEGVWNDEARRRGAEGALYVARVLWSQPKQHSLLPEIAEKLKAGSEPVCTVCFGDSVTGLYYHTGGRRAYTDMLGIALKRTFPRANVTPINEGISGHTTRDALKRIDRDVLRHQPDLVTVMFGLNDMTRVPLDEYRQNLVTIIEKCRAAGAKVLLCTPNSVITTSSRPSEKLKEYCEIVRRVSREQRVALCDCYRAFEAVRKQDPLAWRLLMSDEIHPNRDGHQLLAEEMSRTITGRNVSLADVGPPSPAVPKTLSLLKAGKPVKILAMPPFDESIAQTLRKFTPSAQLDVSRWDIAGQSLAELEQAAKNRVRKMQPDLVVIAVPRTAAAASTEEFIRSYAWIMNWSLSYGKQEWDCIVVHPSVAGQQNSDSARDDLVRRLVGAQDLSLIDRAPNDSTSNSEILVRWLEDQRR
jgi:lysophospholipase L1-like esterase